MELALDQQRFSFWVVGGSPGVVYDFFQRFNVLSLDVATSRDDERRLEVVDGTNQLFFSVGAVDRHADTPNSPQSQVCFGCLRNVRHVKKHFVSNLDIKIFQYSCESVHSSMQLFVRVKPGSLGCLGVVNEGPFSTVRLEVLIKTVVAKVSSSVWKPRAEPSFLVFLVEHFRLVEPVYFFRPLPPVVFKRKVFLGIFGLFFRRKRSKYPICPRALSCDFKFS